jgi:Kef-type K+ transport system membrane component KefB/mannitol/fructose-specific phosphotransferase system IIA component (Ntr-type)
MFGHLLDHHYPLLTFCLLAVAGILGGHLFERAKLPHISGQVIIGIVLGPTALGIFSHESLAQISFLTEIALGVMTFIVGTHLSLKRLHNSGRRILTFAAFDVTLAFLGVFAAMYYWSGQNFVICLLTASIAVSTAPGTVISLIQGKKARGGMVKTLIGVVALNNVATIIVFEVCKVAGIQLVAGADQNAFQLFGTSIFYIVEDLAFGFAMGWLLAVTSKHQHEAGRLFSLGLLAILVSVAVCQMVPQMSSLLVCLALGVAFSNLSYHTTRVLALFDGISDLLFAVFFTLAGTHLDLGLLKTAGVAGLVFIVARGLAKFGAANLAGKVLGCSSRLYRNLGMGLIPQAGLAVGMVISLGEYKIFAENGYAATIATIILASVAVNELIGPFLAAKGLEHSQEAGQATPRVIDFLHEEYILMPLEAKDKWEAIEKMCDFLVKTNHLRSVTREELIECTFARERKFTTGLGNRLAIPHTRIPAQESLMGVVGVARTPIDFESVDKKKVHVVILVATPEGKEDLHLKLLATIAKVFSEGPDFHRKIVNAGTPAEVYDLLQSKEVRKINYFLEENV